MIRAALVAFCVAFWGNSAAGETLGGVTVVLPENSSIVRPGSSVPVKVQLDPLIVGGTVRVVANYSTKIPDLILNQTPYEGVIVVPTSLSGDVQISAFVQTADSFIEGPEVTIRVVPENTSTRIEPSRHLRLRYPSTSSLSGRQISVSGIYSEGIRRWISSSALGTTYATSDPAIATVDADGLLTATGSGIAYITVQNGGARAFTQVTVSDSAGNHPALDVTAKATITQGGVRHDPNTGLYVQEISIRNDSPLPIASSMRLILAGLPTGVSLMKRAGQTERIAPLGSPIAYVEINEQNFLSPGNVAKAILKFRNPDGLPLSYVPKLFLGSAL